jgi:hypothetical protein
MALIGRFETSDYLRHYCERYEADALELAVSLRSHSHLN